MIDGVRMSDASVEALGKLSEALEVVDHGQVFRDVECWTRRPLDDVEPRVFEAEMKMREQKGRP